MEEKYICNINRILVYYTQIAFTVSLNYLLFIGDDAQFYNLINLIEEKYENKTILGVALSTLLIIVVKFIIKFFFKRKLINDNNLFKDVMNKRYAWYDVIIIFLGSLIVTQLIIFMS